MNLTDHEHARLAELARRESGIHIPPSKSTFIVARLRKRLHARSIDNFSDYIEILERDGLNGVFERRLLVSALTTNVTAVYREAHHFKLLAEHLSNWRRDKKSSRYRIWSAGCSTGEEPLSIAATCNLLLGRGWSSHVSILATDIDQSILDHAVNRSKDSALVRTITSVPADLEKFGTLKAKRPNGLIAELQKGIKYLRHDLNGSTYPNSVFDFIFCRNVMIYFTKALQESVQARLISHLADDGIIAVGHSERIGHASLQVIAVGRTSYRKSANINVLGDRKT